jgi:hypothetical protein
LRKDLTIKVATTGYAQAYFIRVLPRGIDKDFKDLTIERATTSCAKAHVIRVLPRGLDEDCKDLTIEIATISHAQACCIRVLPHGIDKDCKDFTIERATISRVVKVGQVIIKVFIVLCCYQQRMQHRIPSMRGIPVVNVCKSLPRSKNKNKSKVHAWCGSFRSCIQQACNGN